MNLDYNRQMLIDRVFERITKVKRFEGFTRKDVEKSIHFFESAILSEMIAGRGIMVRGQLSIFPDPGSLAVMRRKRMVNQQNFVRNKHKYKK